MSELVSTFLDVSFPESRRYLFFIVAWNDYVTPISDELEKQGKAFGADLGPKGSVIRAYSSHAKSTFAEVQAKAWPKDIRLRFDSEQDPFMLITAKGFEEFDPAKDGWAIIWFSSFFEKPDSIYRVFASLAQKVERDEDVFKYARSVAEKTIAKRLAKYFELKPEVFGVSLDVNAILEDILSSSS